MSNSRSMDKEAVVYTYKMEYCSAIKMNPFLLFLMRLIKPEPTTGSEVSQKEESKYYALNHICGI